MFSAVARIFRTPDLRRKIGFTLGIIALFRLGSFIPAPFVDFENVQACLVGNSGNAAGSLYDLVNLFSGGALLQLSIFALGIMPYITASIIVQLLRVVIPRFDTLYKEGQSGQAQADAVHPLPHHRARRAAVDHPHHGRPQRCSCSATPASPSAASSSRATAPPGTASCSWSSP